MSEFAKPRPASTNFIAPGTFEGSAIPRTVLSDLLTFSALGSFVPRSNASGFLSSVMCFRPIDVSPASYIPGESFARGSFASEPVMPAGSGGAGWGANGLGGGGAGGGGGGGGAEGVGDGDGVWANAPAANSKEREATNKERTVRIRFMISPLEKLCG